MKAFNVPTLESRVARITNVDELNEEIRKAKTYVMTIRKHVKKADGKVDRDAMNDALTKAERVLRQLRLKYFDIEEAVMSRAN